jgi:hypothetical protein
LFENVSSKQHCNKVLTLELDGANISVDLFQNIAGFWTTPNTEMPDERFCASL